MVPVELRLPTIFVGGGRCWPSGHTVFFNSENLAEITTSLSALSTETIVTGIEYERIILRSEPSFTSLAWSEWSCIFV
jgi:hypothetical protein